MRVIVTRPRAQAAGWVDSLNRHGIDAVALPLIAIAGPPDPSAVAAAWATLARRRLVVFVSPNAAEAFFLHAPPGAVWPAQLRAASPGPGTTVALVRLGVPAAAVVEPAPDAPQFDSEALWAALAASEWRAASVLIVRGTSGRDWLAAQFTNRGAQVDRLAAYTRTAPPFDAVETRRLEAALAEPRRHLWLFSSSEAIDHLVRPAQLPSPADAAGLPSGGIEADAAAAERRLGAGPVFRANEARALATHPRIATRARQAGFGHVHESRPTLAAVVACIQSIRP